MTRDGRGTCCPLWDGIHCCGFGQRCPVMVGAATSGRDACGTLSRRELTLMYSLNEKQTKQQGGAVGANGHPWICATGKRALGLPVVWTLFALVLQVRATPSLPLLEHGVAAPGEQPARHSSKRSNASLIVFDASNAKHQHARKSGLYASHRGGLRSPCTWPVLARLLAIPSTAAPGGYACSCAVQHAPPQFQTVSSSGCGRANG